MLPDLHDAVFERIDVDWEAATVTLHFTAVPGGPVILIARGYRELRVSHREPWGPSVWVNTAELTSDDADAPVTLHVEMQSGDPIDIVADQLDIENELS
jgi:hypothetical protein